MTRRKPGRPASPRARYRQIAADLRARLRSGEFAPGAAMPGLRRLARGYGTSDYTVRAAMAMLRSEGLIRTSPRRQLTATGTGSARGVLDGLVLLVSSHPLDALHRGPYSDELLRGIQIGAGEMKAPFLALHGERFRTGLPDEALELPLGGVVLFGLFRAEALRGYERLGVPAVLVDQPCARCRLHSMTVDNFSAARDAARRLIAMGHRRIAFVRFVQLGMRRVDPDARERQEGFLAALDEAGLRRSAGPVFNSLDSDTPESPTIRAVVRERPPVTAVLSASGFRAELVAAAAAAEGLSVPGDLSVVCFQGTEADYPRFSGPRVDFEEMGRRAVHLLAEPRHPPQHARMPAEWVDAGSTAAPPEAGR